MIATAYLTKYWELIPTTILTPKGKGSDVQISDSFTLTEDDTAAIFETLKGNATKTEMEVVVGVLSRVNTRISLTIDHLDAVSYTHPTIKLVGNPDGIMNVTFDYGLLLSPCKGSMVSEFVGSINEQFSI